MNLVDLRSLLYCALAFLIVVVSASGNQIFNSPEDYFGGDDNDAYVSWAMQSEIQSSYSASLFMPSANDQTDGAAIHWKIEGDMIELAVIVKATGWLGFGISEAGGMRGADMVLFESDEPDKIRDAYVLEERLPLDDECADWEFVNASVTEDDSFLIVEVKRLLDTGDGQDRPIIRDDSIGVPMHRIVAAWGDSSGRVGYHGEKRARGAVRWFNFGADPETAFQAAMESEAQGSFTIQAVDYTIPTRQTIYADFCISWSDIVRQGVPDQALTVIGFQPFIDQDTVQHVHHFVLYAGRQTMDGVECDDMYEVYYVWAPGEPSLAAPSNVGFSLGGDSYKIFRLEIHYDNPEFLEGQVDSSGVRLFYTTQPRQYEMAMLQIADPFVGMSGQRVGNGLTQHSFLCPSSCSNFVIDEPVTVFREYLHMHATGVSMRNELIRDGEIVHVGQVDYFDFDQQGNPAAMQEPYQIQPGDAFRTVCNYRPTRSTRFGAGSDDEMCIGFLLYYPKHTSIAPLWACGHRLYPFQGVCLATHETRELDDNDAEEGLRRVFGRSCSSPPLEPIDKCDLVEPCGRASRLQQIFGVRYPLHRTNPLFGGDCRTVCVSSILLDFYKRQGYECGECPE